MRLLQVGRPKYSMFFQCKEPKTRCWAFEGLPAADIVQMFSRGELKGSKTTL